MSEIASTPAKLSDTQLVILSAAAQRSDRPLLPFPQSLGAKGAALGKVIEVLSRRRLVMEKRVINGETEWRRDEEAGPLGLFITDDGLLALGLDEPEKEQLLKAAVGKTRQNKKPAARPRSKAPKAPPGGAKKRGGHTQTKQDLVIQMLRRQSGVSVDDIIAKTDWQPHSVRGFFSTVVRKKLKLPLVSEVGKDGVRRYHTAPSWIRQSVTMNRSLIHRPRPKRGRGRSSTQVQGEDPASLASRVLGLPSC